MPEPLTRRQLMRATAASLAPLAMSTRVARRDEGAHWGFETEEQRRQAGCPAAKS